MKDVDVARLADVVSDRVFESMSKFVDVLQGLVRENEALRSKVDYLELMVFGPEEPDDFDDDDDDFELNDGPCGDPSCGTCGGGIRPEDDEIDSKLMRN